MSREHLFSPPQDVQALQEQEFLKKEASPIRELPLITSDLNASFNFDNFNRVNKTVDLLSFRNKMRELQRKPSVREISPESDKGESDEEWKSRNGGLNKRLSSIFDQDINTSEMENAKLIINMAQKYGRIK